ncbi:PREDICTED: epsilon-sarcoglycan isoform X1 [Drosophila arizonae]|uniref:Epsilon-sarcoglycan isoform X1 n=1 Tax=Drosophila arizonae TaxID=7263 RepID=A0ABM1NW24_DROAR|nr:PREDICTED: epsilon-sarcoglycan isoform X1 [Drosophila arizonae]
MHLLLVFVGCLGVASSSVFNLHLQANVGELFTFKIEPQLFNWTHQVISEQFRYRPSLQHYPDLPSWMRYMYSHEYHAGFLYGTPPVPAAGKTLNLDVIALNRQNYETRQLVISMFVAHKFITPNVVQMKIDNLNWVHLMDPGRVENLRNIFRKDLWPDSKDDLSVVFMESAINMGGRLPLRPQQREGVIVHVGSFAQFSPRLKELQEEVRPLYKLPSCTYKRTSVQKIFENVGFKLDWCAFKMVGIESPTEVLYHNNHGRVKEQLKEHRHQQLQREQERWLGIPREDVPIRNYIDEFAFAFAIPGMIFAVLVGILSAVLCFQHQKFYDPQSELFFANIFNICEETCAAAPNDSDVDEGSSVHIEYPMSSTVQMVQCSDTKPMQPVTTLKSLKDPNFLLDNTSMRSQSPNNSLYQLDTGASGIYARPKPPPYKGGTLGRNGVDI